MIFVAAIDTPALTTQAAPLLTPLPIVLGTITRVLVYFPPGCSGLAHCAISWGIYQLFPSNQPGDFHADGEIIQWDDDVLIDSQPAALTIATWNLDDTYDHVVTVHVVVTPSTSAGNSASVIAQLMAPAVAPGS